jgi:hypothetical protein
MGKLLTERQKDAIRDSPCGKCRASPPFADGSRCQTHRIVPSREGGQYTKENTVPRCPTCHALEPGHGGRGLILLPMSKRCEAGKKAAERLHELHPTLARENGLKYGKQGGQRVHELHPGLASRAAKRAHELHPGLAARTMRRTNELHPNLARENGLKYGRKAAHVQHHVNKGVVNPTCPYCQAEQES